MRKESEGTSDEDTGDRWSDGCSETEQTECERVIENNLDGMVDVSIQQELKQPAEDAGLDAGSPATPEGDEQDGYRFEGD